MGQYEAAVHLAREALRHPALVHWSGHTALISALGTLGRRDEGQVSVIDLLRLRPDFTIGLLERSIMVTEPSYLARYIDGLRKAGLPE